MEIKPSSECQLPLYLGLPGFFGTTVRAHTRPFDPFSAFLLASMLVTSPCLALSMVKQFMSPAPPRRVVPLQNLVSLVGVVSRFGMDRRKFMIL